MKKTFSLLFLIATLPVIHAATVVVEMRNNFFLPADVTINVGDTVTWVQRGSNHDTVSYDGLWASELLRLNQTFSFTFNSPGDFQYYCTPHEQVGMIGWIRVRGTGNPPPTVTLTEPSAISTFAPTDTITFSATASDDGSIAKVEFFAGNSLVGTDTTSPYSVTGNLSAGSYSVTARATDNLGATTTSAAVTITVEPAANQSPTVTLVSLVSGVISAPGTLQLQANAQDPDGSIVKVEFFNGQTSLGVDTSAPYELQLSDLVAGIYSFTAVATDNAGATTTSAAVQVQIATAPQIGSLTRAGGNTSVTAAATTGIPHILETSENLSSWNSMATNIPVAGSVTFNVADSGASVFYRIVLR